METYKEPKDPSELKDYEYDWSDQLGEGETVVSHVVAFVDAAGTANPNSSLVTPFSRIWLSGGNAGGKVVYTIKAVTSGGRELEVALGVNIVDSTTVPTDVENLKADLAVVDATMRRFMAGDLVKEVSRDGRRIVKDNPTFQQLTDHREFLLTAIAAAEATDSGRPRRRAIVLAYRN